MKTITLETIETEHNKVAELIAQFRTQATTKIVFPRNEISLTHGEHYAGVILGRTISPEELGERLALGLELPPVEKDYHLILTPHQKSKISWNDAMEWAKSVGGDLPTRREQSLLFANLKDKFKEAWYWSRNQHASYSDYAWVQYFNIGTQSYDYKNYTCEAFAVRRLVIE